MSRDVNDSKSRGSLGQQIRLAAKQVAEHRQAASFHRAALGERIHERLTAPSTLLFAAGTGFVIGELTSQPAPERDSENSQESGRRPKGRAKAVFMFALRMFTLARAASSAMPGPHEVQAGP